MNNPRRLDKPGMTSGEKPAVFAIASGKGGVGKSVIAFNLAHCLSKSSRVLLIDGDFQMGNLHLLANSAPEIGLQDCCCEHLVLSQSVTPVGENIDLLASISARPEELLPDMKTLALFLSELRIQANKYDFVIIDTASGILPHTNLILNAADEIVLVTTPELTSISDCYALYKILVVNNPNISASLLINRESNSENIEYLYEKFTAITDQFLGHKPAFFGFLADDPANML